MQARGFTTYSIYSLGGCDWRRRGGRDLARGLVRPRAGAGAGRAWPTIDAGEFHGTIAQAVRLAEDGEAAAGAAAA